MEADWELELGSGAPVIDGAWPGFIDLRVFPNRSTEIEETRLLPALGDALIRLNAHSSPVWTAKCDVWIVQEPIDPYELDALPQSTAQTIACYIDLLPRSDQQWNDPQRAASDCKALCERLRAIPLRCCRADLVVRRAYIAPDVSDLGITAYLTGCGESEDGARQQLAMVLAAFADTLLPVAAPTRTVSPLQ